ncbi:MAG: alpha/beta hydrolase [Terracidiphilus sp.]
MKLLIRILWSVAALAAVWLGVCAVAGIQSAEGALHPGRRALTPADEAQAAAMAKADNATLQPTAITAADGVVLRAWFFRANQGNGDAVIVLHGQGDNRLGLLAPAELLLRHGYSVLLPDSRAQGLSGGDVATYGVKEADDIRRWFDWLAQTEAPHCINGLGESMGAAQVLQSLRTIRGYCAVVAESPFSSFRDASFDRIGQWFGTGPWLGRTLLRPTIGFGFLYVRWKYSVNLAQDNPARAVATSRVPVFLIDGLLDDNLPPRNDEKILAVSRGRNPNVVLWEPADAGHTGALGAEPEEYERRVIGWLQSHRAAASR